MSIFRSISWNTVNSIQNLVRFNEISNKFFFCPNELIPGIPVFRSFVISTDIDKIDRPITADITTRSQPAKA